MTTFERIVVGIIGGVFVGFVYHFIGEGAAISVIGGWILMTQNYDN